MPKINALKFIFSLIATAIMQRNGASKKAIIVGISEYDLLRPLAFCKTDGTKMYELLKSLGYEIQDNHKLIGRVGREEMRDAIINFFRNRNVRPKDTLLFYYSGHGILDAYGDYYFAASALNPIEPDTEGFLFDELTKIINKSTSQKIITILDCCYSGGARIGKGGEEDAANAGRKAIDEKSRILVQGEGKCILAASQASQKAFETAQKNHSLFTYYLLDGLSGNEHTVDIDGCVTPDLLGNYIYDKIMSLPSEQRSEQTPIRKVEQSGNIILACYPHLARRGTSYSQTNSIEDLRLIIDRCKEHYNKGELEVGLTSLEEATNKYPYSSDLWNIKGMAFTKLRLYDKATYCFDLATRLNPKSSTFWINKGDCLSQQGKLEEAIRSLDNALDIDVSNSYAWSLKSRLLLNKGKYNEVIEYLDKARGHMDEMVLWCDRGAAFSGLGMYHDAILCHDNVLKIDPNFEISLNNKGLCLLSLGKYLEAIQCFDRILALNPNIKHVLMNKYEGLVKLGRTKDAKQCYERAQRLVNQ